MMRPWLARLRWTFSIGIAAFLFLVFHRATPADDDRARFDHRVATVRRVVDGNTLDVDCNGSAVRVRLLGINATSAASDYLMARAERKTITLRLDELAASRDDGGELLAYAYLDDAELLNQSMIRDGVAYAYRVGDCDLLASFAAEENGARAARRGLWKTITPEQMPAWRRRWMREQHLN